MRAHTRAAGIHSSDVRALFMPMDCISSLQNWLQALNYWDMRYAVASHQLNHVPLMCRYIVNNLMAHCVSQFWFRVAFWAMLLKIPSLKLVFVLWIRPLIANYCGIVWDYNICFEKKSTRMFACGNASQNYFFIMEWHRMACIWYNRSKGKLLEWTFYERASTM